MKRKKKTQENDVRCWNQLPLALATTQDIVDELVRRPNTQFIILLPHGDTPVSVQVHSANIPIPLALGMFKATYDKVLATFDGSEEK